MLRRDGRAQEGRRCGAAAAFRKAGAGRQCWKAGAAASGPRRSSTAPRRRSRPARGQVGRVRFETPVPGASGNRRMDRGSWFAPPDDRATKRSRWTPPRCARGAAVVTGRHAEPWRCRDGGEHAYGSPCLRLGAPQAPRFVMVAATGGSCPNAALVRGDCRLPFVNADARSTQSPPCRQRRAGRVVRSFARDEGGGGNAEWAGLPIPHSGESTRRQVRFSCIGQVFMPSSP